MAAFTTIATGVSLAATAGGTGASFVQAGKQNRLRRQAEEEAAKAMSEARKKLEVNYFAALGINKEPYELEREAALVQGAMATEAGRESERGAAATAGRVQAMQQQQQREIAAAMGTEMFNLDKLTAEEAARLRDMQATLDLEEAKGAQAAALEAKQAAAAATTQGFEGVTSLASQLMELAPLYGKSKQVSPTGGSKGLSKTASGFNFNTTPKATEQPAIQPQNLTAEDYILNPFDLDANQFLRKNG